MSTADESAREMTRSINARSVAWPVQLFWSIVLLLAPLQADPLPDELRQGGFWSIQFENDV